MELKSLILGLLFSLGAFGVKTGIGLQYVFSRQVSRGGRLAVGLLAALAYLAVFSASAVLVRRVDLLQYYKTISGFMASGMFIHLAMALLLGLWGIRLLKRRDHEKTASAGWLVLVVPCPVCMTAILFATGFLVAWFPEKQVASVGLMYLGFMGLALAAGTITACSRHSACSPEKTLGAAMLLAAAFFLVSMAVVPQFADVDKIYRLAGYQGGNTPASGWKTVLVGSTAGLLFMTGFIGAAFKQMRKP